MARAILAAPIWYQEMQTDSRILGVIERLYAAAAGLEAWDEAVASLVGLMDGGHGALHQIGSGGNLHLAAYAGLDEDDQALFRSREATELFAPLAAMLPLNTATSTFQLCSEREYESSALYNEVIRPANGFYGAGVIGLVPSGPPGGRRCLYAHKAGKRGRRRSGRGTGPCEHRGRARHSRRGGATIFEASFRQNWRAQSRRVGGAYPRLCRTLALSGIGQRIAAMHTRFCLTFVKVSC